MRERRALRRLRDFLAAHRTSLGEVDVHALVALERGFMRAVQRRLPRARLVGVPRGAEGAWREFVRLYCAYLVASGRLEAPCTVLVAFAGAGALRACMLRRDRDGRVRLLC